MRRLLLALVLTGCASGLPRNYVRCTDAPAPPRWCLQEVNDYLTPTRAAGFVIPPGCVIVSAARDTFPTEVVINGYGQPIFTKHMGTRVTLACPCPRDEVR